MKRKTSGKPTAVRKRADSPRKIERNRAIFRITLEELSLGDYGALSIERIAGRAGVNKTTLYRRWPTKADLVRAALMAIVDATDPGASHGSLKADLLAVGRKILEISQSVEGQSLLRLRLLDHPEPDLADIAATLQARRQERLARILAAAVSRGELRPSVDVGFLMDMLAGLIHLRLFVKKGPVDDRMLKRAVDVLVDGVSPARRRGRG